MRLPLAGCAFAYHLPLTTYRSRPLSTSSAHTKEYFTATSHSITMTYTFSTARKYLA